MKALKFIFPLLFLALIGSCETPQSAADYYDNILSKTNPLITQYEQNLLDAFTDYVPEEMEEAYEELENHVTEMNTFLDGQEDYYGDAKLLNSAKELGNAYEEALPLYKEKVELESLSDEDYTEEIADKSSALMDEIDEILNDANGAYIDATHTFADEHGFEIKKY